MEKILFVADRIVDVDGSEATALAVQSGRIIGKGTEDDFSTWIDQNTQRIRLDGTVLPGFVESHAHLLMMGQVKEQIDCGTPPNGGVTDILNRIKEEARRLGPNQWILGFHYDESLLSERRPPTLEELTAAAPANPVYLTHNSGHLAVVNQRALDIAGMTVQTSIPGVEKRAGRLTGVLKEATALEAVSRYIPKPGLDEYVRYIRSGSADCLKVGVTSMTDAAMGLGDDRNSKLIWDSYQRASETGDLMVRVQCYARVRDHDSFVPDPMNSPDLLAGGVKLFADGSIQGHTAALNLPYSDQHDEQGMLLYQPDELAEVIHHFHQQRRQVIIHCNGDRAIDTAITAYAKILRDDPGNPLRHRIEHAQMASREQLIAMKELSVLPSFFVNHVYYYGDRHYSLFLGPERGQRISPLRDAVSLDLRFSIHSDCPVTPLNPLYSIYIASTRTTRNGHILGADQTISVMDALRAYTSWAAYLGLREDSVGRLMPGLWADFVVVDRSPFQNTETSRVLSTWVGGECRYIAE